MVLTAAALRWPRRRTRLVDRELVALGCLVVPRRFVTTFAGAPADLEATLEVEVGLGRWRVTRVEVSAGGRGCVTGVWSRLPLAELALLALVDAALREQPAGAPARAGVTTEDGRHWRHLGGAAERAEAVHVLRGAQEPGAAPGGSDGEPGAAPGGPDGEPGAAPGGSGGDPGAAARGSGEEPAGPVPPDGAGAPRPVVRRMRVTPQRLAAVAAAYRTAFEGGDAAPVQAVAAQLDLSALRARALVQQARQAGLLPPTRRGRASA